MQKGSVTSGLGCSLQIASETVSRNEGPLPTLRNCEQTDFAICSGNHFHFKCSQLTLHKLFIFLQMRAFAPCSMPSGSMIVWTEVADFATTVLSLVTYDSCCFVNMLPYLLTAHLICFSLLWQSYTYTIILKSFTFPLHLPPNYSCTWYEMDV